jgi:hypothetical protein
MVRVESWFDNGDVPKTGQVEVFGDAGDLLVKGRLSSQGLFLFDAPEARPLRVVIDAGEGHGKELAIGAGELVAVQVPEKAAPLAESTPPTYEQPFPIKDVLTGIGLLVAVAALVLSVRNARSIRALKRPEDGR